MKNTLIALKNKLIHNQKGEGLASGLIVVFVIILAGGLMFIFPLMHEAQLNEDNARLAIQVAISELTDKTATRSEINPKDLAECTQKIDATGIPCELKIEVQHLDGNAGKKSVTTAPQLAGDEANLRYSVFTPEVYKVMYKDGTEVPYDLKKGDYVIYTVENISPTLYQQIREGWFTITGQGAKRIIISDSCMVIN